MRKVPGPGLGVGGSGGRQLAGSSGCMVWGGKERRERERDGVEDSHRGEVVGVLLRDLMSGFRVSSLSLSHALFLSHTLTLSLSPKRLALSLSLTPFLPLTHALSLSLTHTLEFQDQSLPNGEGTTLNDFRNVRTENGSSQVQDLASTSVFVLTSLDSG